MELRKAVAGDMDCLVELRKRQLIDEGLTPCDIDKELKDFFEAKLGDGSLVSWLAVEGEQIVATSAVYFYQLPPSYSNPSGITAYITNMFTEPEYRRRGLAVKLLEKAVEEAKDRGCVSVRLQASRDGRPLYERFGFQEFSDNMILYL